MGRSAILPGVVVATLLAACSTTPFPDALYTEGFRGGFAASERTCGGVAVDATDLIERIYPDLLAYITQEGFGAYVDMVDLHRPGAWGYKHIGGELHVQYLFDEAVDDPGPDAPLVLMHGGLMVTVAACTGTFKYAGEFRF